MKYCSNCGNKINGKVSFCNSCGRRLTSSKESHQHFHNNDVEELGDNEDSWNCDYCNESFILENKELKELEKKGKIKITCPHCKKIQLCEEPFAENKTLKSISRGNVNYVETNEIIKSAAGGFWKALIWIIVLLVIFFIVGGILSNIGSNGGSLQVSSNSQNNWWGTTHTSTSVGYNRVATESHSCPFWNRNC